MGEPIIFKKQLLTLGFQSNSANRTNCAAVSVMPELHALIDKTATRQVLTSWNRFTFI